MGTKANSAKFAEELNEVKLWQLSGIVTVAMGTYHLRDTRLATGSFSFLFKEWKVLGPNTNCMMEMLDLGIQFTDVGVVKTII